MTYKKGKYIVECENGKYVINKLQPFLKTRAYTLLWYPLEGFDSFIHAVRYLKKYENYII